MIFVPGFTKCHFNLIFMPGFAKCEGRDYDSKVKHSFCGTMELKILLSSDVQRIFVSLFPTIVDEKPKPILLVPFKVRSN